MKQRIIFHVWWCFNLKQRIWKGQWNRSSLVSGLHSENQGCKSRNPKRNGVSDATIYRPISDLIGQYRPICKYITISDVWKPVMNFTATFTNLRQNLWEYNSCFRSAASLCDSISNSYLMVLIAYFTRKICGNTSWIPFWRTTISSSQKASV